MERFTTVARLGYTADICDLHIVAIRLSLNGFNNILRRSDIDLHHALRLVVSTRRNHTSDVQDIVRTRYAF